LRPCRDIIKNYQPKVYNKNITKSMVVLINGTKGQEGHPSQRQHTRSVKFENSSKDNYRLHNA